MVGRYALIVSMERVDCEMHGRLGDEAVARPTMRYTYGFRFAQQSAHLMIDIWLAMRLSEITMAREVGCIYFRRAGRSRAP